MQRCATSFCDGTVRVGGAGRRKAWSPITLSRVGTAARTTRLTCRPSARVATPQRSASLMRERADEFRGRAIRAGLHAGHADLGPPRVAGAVGARAAHAE